MSLPWHDRQQGRIGSDIRNKKAAFRVAQPCCMGMSSSCPTFPESRTTPVQLIDLATQTTFAELLQRTLDADFDEQFPERGTFRRKKSKDRFYWQFQWREGTTVKSRYVLPVSDKAITDRVNRVEQIKSDYKGRRELVRSLTAADLATPDRASPETSSRPRAAPDTFGCAACSSARSPIKPTPAFKFSARSARSSSPKPGRRRGIPAIAGATNWRRAEPGSATTRKRR
jgi:hypothetical protein